MHGAAPPSPNENLGLSLTSALRARTSLFRFSCMGLIALMLGTVTHWPYAPLWLVAYLAVQGALAYETEVRPRRGQALRPTVIYAGSFVNFAICGAPVWHMWTNNGELGIAAATMFLSGMLVQLTTASLGARKLFWLSASPLIAYLVFVPLLAFWPTRPMEGLVAATCAVLLVAYMGALWLGHQDALDQLMDDRREADRRRFEAEGANQAKTDFLAVMSHEVRTPMNAVLGAAHMLERSDLNPEQRAHVAMISDAGRVLMDVLNDVLDLARIEAGKLSISPEPTDVRALTRRCAETWRAAAQAKGLDFACEIDDALPQAVLIDGGRTSQILFNFLSNAVKFTSQGRVCIRVRTAGRDRVAFEVSDTGSGITQEAQGRLFQAFEQADNSISRRHGGAGLGLAISQRLAQMMGGAISLRSNIGEGSTFTLALDAPGARMAPAEAAAEPQEPLDAGVLRILVAEDNVANQKIVVMFLQPLGAELTVVGDGRQALDALAHEPFDLVLMDMQMPNMDGLEATRQLRASGGPNAATPVIALTANVLDSQKKACADAGMDDHVAKPIDPKILIERVLALAGRASKSQVVA